MASKEHIALAEQIKAVHGRLRDEANSIGAAEAWKKHVSNSEVLNKYAEAMKKLATCHWESNQNDENNRIIWAVTYARQYFKEQQIILKERLREFRILQCPLNKTDMDYIPDDSIKLLDVGSCYNPFVAFDEFEVLGIDIAPAIPSVFKCDFLTVDISDELKESNDQIDNLPRNTYNIITFSLLLEYLPSSDQRILACKKAYELLKTEGILIVMTPDSKHQGSNAKLMKNWRYTLALLGFRRIKIEKLRHITCMVFRKAIDCDLAVRWAEIHKEEYMKNALEIPQDKKRKLSELD